MTDLPPIENFRDLIRALFQVQKRVKERTPMWYLLNKFQREAMKEADSQEAYERGMKQAIAADKKRSGM